MPAPCWELTPATGGWVTTSLHPGGNWGSHSSWQPPEAPGHTRTRPPDRTCGQPGSHPGRWSTSAGVWQLPRCTFVGSPAGHPFNSCSCGERGPSATERTACAGHSPPASTFQPRGTGRWGLSSWHACKEIAARAGLGHGVFVPGSLTGGREARP